MLDHVALNVTDFERSRESYVRSRRSWIGIVMELPDAKVVGLGDGGKPYLWVCERGAPCTSTHVALAAPDTDTVDAFCEAAIAAGGVDDGPPGPRPAYHEGTSWRLPIAPGEVAHRGLVRE